MEPNRRNSQQFATGSLLAGSFGELFGKLAGEWQLTREISDGTRFEGLARFTAISDNSYRLEETGQLYLQKFRSLNAMREWQWILQFGDHLDIRYPAEQGGGMYHHVELAIITGPSEKIWQGTARHDCGDDVYIGHYRLAADHLDIGHRINGPNKDLTIKSQFARQ